MFLALVGVVLVDRMVRKSSDAPRVWLRPLGVGLSVASIVFAAVSVYWIYRIGHSGSKAVWQPTQTRIDKGTRLGREGDG
jgi:hypothetical protein